jgi:aerobic carbon-monoxide dehydrogenase medium subunit
MNSFELAEPRSLRESIALLDRDDPAIRPIAGGTALMLMMKAGFFKPIRLVSLRRIEPRYSRIASADDGTLRIGAMATLTDLEHSDELRRHAPAITRMMRDVANVRVRNVATVGGNLAHADPHLDLPPVWIALGARIVIAGADGERTIPVDALFSGYYETTLRHNELISEVILPPQANRRSAYLKCMARSAHDWPAIGVAVSFALNAGLIDEPRIAIGGATAIPTRLAAAEAVLRGARLDEALLVRAADAAVAEADIAGDQHGSAPYKRQLLRVYLPRAVRAAFEAGA